MRVIIVNFHELCPNIQILVTPLICILYLSSLALCNLVLLFCCFALLRNLALLLYCFVYLSLMRYSCHMQSFDILVHLIQRVLCYKHLSMFYVNQSLYCLKCVKYLEYLDHLDHLKYPKHSKRFEYLEYFQSRLVYLTFRFLNSDFYLACLEVFLGRV